MTQAPPPPATQKPAAKTPDAIRKEQGGKEENREKSDMSKSAASASKTSVPKASEAEKHIAEMKGAPSEAPVPKPSEAEKRLTEMRPKTTAQVLANKLNQQFARSQSFPAFRVSLIRLEAGPGARITVYLSYTNKTGGDLQLGLCYPKSRNTTRLTDNAAYDYTFVSGNGVGDVCSGSSFPLIVPAGVTTHASMVFEPTTEVRQQPETFSLVSQHVVVDRAQGALQVQSTHTVSLTGQAPR
jgi:hypothetical protein